MRTRIGWVPQQHGAWAMLLVPFLVGAIVRIRSGLGLPPFLWPLLACWLLGYFAFNAAVLWLKAPPARRAALGAPVAVYSLAAAVAGLCTLTLRGPSVLGWVPLFTVLTAAALALAARHQDRSTLSGALTTAAAASLSVVTAHPDPAELAPWSPAVQAVCADAALLFAYFFGTVLYVKTNIRERASHRFYVASIAWHVAATAMAALLGATGRATPGWIALLGAATIRAMVVPRQRPRLSPRSIGLIEAAFCLAICAIVAAGG